MTHTLANFNLHSDAWSLKVAKLIAAPQPNWGKDIKMRNKQTKHHSQRT